MDEFIQLTKQLITLLTFPDHQLEGKQEDDCLSLTLTLPNEDSGILIGYRGEKIDALQFILNLLHNQKNISYEPVNLDINGYRQRRTESLHRLADKALLKAIDSGREIILPPLPSYERRIIHIYLSQKSEVTTYSEGEGLNRRLVVRPSTVENLTVK